MIEVVAVHAVARSRGVRARDVIGFGAGIAVTIGSQLPWATASWLDGVESDVHVLTAGRLELLLAGTALVVAVAADHLRRGTTLVVTGVALLTVGVVTADITAVVLIASLTGGSSTSPLGIGPGIVVLAVSVPLLVVVAAAAAQGRARLAISALAVVIVGLAAVIGLFMGDRVHDESYDFSIGVDDRSSQVSPGG